MEIVPNFVVMKSAEVVLCTEKSALVKKTMFPRGTCHCRNHFLIIHYCAFHQSPLLQKLFVSSRSATITLER